MSLAATTTRKRVSAEALEIERAHPRLSVFEMARKLGNVTEAGQHRPVEL